ncbi:MAG: dTDP-4-dehydrorhamnose 3,5-epimerase family protein [Chthonomonadales bacterium]
MIAHHERPPIANPEILLPFGVQLKPLKMNQDDRGSFTEIYREEWMGDLDPMIQWNVVSTKANTIRGVHVHHDHVDYLICVSGRVSVGLSDLRKESPTEGLATLIEMSGENLGSIFIPVGVAHGFYFHEDSMHVYGVSSYFDKADFLGCKWDDPELGIPWTCRDPWISDRDNALPPFRDIISRVAPWQGP